MSCALPDCDGPVLLSVAVLAGMASPLESPCWPGLTAPLSKREIGDAIAEGRLIAPAEGPAVRVSRSVRISRVAWFAVHGWSDPISVDIGVPGYQGFRSAWPVEDDNHRFAAAIFRGDGAILAEFGGSIAEASRLGLFV